MTASRGVGPGARLGQRRLQRLLLRLDVRAARQRHDAAAAAPAPSAESIDCFIGGVAARRAFACVRSASGVAASMSRFVFSRRSANRSGAR